MTEQRGRARVTENEKYLEPDVAALREALLEHLNSVPLEFHQKYQIPSLEVQGGRFVVSRHT
jgi:hypothetical protein